LKLSIIIPVLDSHEIVRRQILYYEKLGLPNDVEIMLIDDGSDPALTTDSKLKNLHIIATGDYRPWTEEKARNYGAKLATGEYIMMADVDHILTHSAIMAAREFTGDKMEFLRRFGTLDENGEIDTRKETFKAYGLRKKWMPREGLQYVPGHRQNFCMRKALYWRLGGYKEHLVGVAYPYGGGADSKFYTKWRQLERHGRVKTYEEKPEIYFIPNGKYCGSMNADPLKLFHNLSRKSGNFKSKVA
jgi:glycosyltransferase involved in cell wall biosynthesis